MLCRYGAGRLLRIGGPDVLKLSLPTTQSARSKLLVKTESPAL